VIQPGVAERLDADAIARMLDDLSRADLGDPRRVARAQRVVERLASTPDASLPDAMVTEAELEGAYRLFNNEHISFERLIDAHVKGTIERARSAGLVLAIHDTTYCTFRHADPREVGYLPTGHAGFPLHLTLLVDTEQWRRPLGLIHAEVLPRATLVRRRAQVRKRSSNDSAKDPNSEFLRWYRGIDIAQSQVEPTGTCLLHVADRECDSYALMAMCLARKARFIFRARNNRNALQGGIKVPIRDLIGDSEVVLEREVPLSRRLGASAPKSRRVHPPRDSRVARLCFTRTNATFRRPGIAGAHLPKTIAINVLHVFEVDVPAAQEPVDWLLYTTEALDTQEQIESVVDYYRCRWQIEELNKALKTGCVVQDRQLESFEALTTMLALSLPIAVELLALRTLARSDEMCPARVVFNDQQLAALRHISHRPLPDHPTAQDALWCIAGLGGHTKNNGQPGWQVLQRGMEKFVAFAAGWCARGVAADL
jgi:hypothetical protein